MNSRSPGVTAQALLTQLAGESLQEWHEAESNIEIAQMAPGQTLFRAGDAVASVHFVRSGLVKHVYLNADGEEWIKGFSYENTFFASISALQTGGRATFSCVSIEPTCIERIDYSVLLKLAERHMTWQRALRRGFELFGAKKERRERDLLTLSATERYEAFVRDSPRLAERIPKHELAKHLGMTAVTLSRIRGRLSQREARRQNTSQSAIDAPPAT